MSGVAASAGTIEPRTGERRLAAGGQGKRGALIVDQAKPRQFLNLKVEQHRLPVARNDGQHLFLLFGKWGQERQLDVP